MTMCGVPLPAWFVEPKTWTTDVRCQLDLDDHHLTHEARVQDWHRCNWTLGDKSAVTLTYPHDSRDPRVSMT